MGRVKNTAGRLTRGPGGAPAPGRAEIIVRHCMGLAEFKECVQIQRIVWGEDLVVPSPLFVVARETGGQALGAFDGEKMIGFTLAMPGLHERKPFLHSHMTAVLEEYRNRGVGRQLKLLQREDALARGIQLVEWTFDPLELKNAHFNINQLGAIARRYIPDCYGITDSPLHAGLPTDRLVAEWWLDSPHVRSIIEGGKKGARLASGELVKRIRVPADIGDIRQKDRAAGVRIQSEIREQFQAWFGHGYVVTGLEASGPTVDYLLQPAGEVARQTAQESAWG